MPNPNITKKTNRASQSLLLDNIPNAKFAYSVFKLRTNYFGYCMRVRRSSDNTETDIPFSENYIDLAFLMSFVGTGDGFVSVWYDQSLNANNFIQATQSKQPKIVGVGIVLMANNRAKILFDGSNDIFFNTNQATSGEFSIFSVLKSETVNNNFLMSTNIDSVNGSTIGTFSGNSWRWQNSASSQVNVAFTTPTTQTVLSTIHDGSNNFDLYFGLTSKATGQTLTGTYNLNSIGGRENLSGSFYCNDSFQELILWESDLSSKRTNIVTEATNKYYYGGFWAGITDAYFYGDSITFGVNATTTSRRYSTRICSQNKVTEQNFGASGQALIQGTSNSFNISTFAAKPNSNSRIFLAWGVNDGNPAKWGSLYPNITATAAACVSEYTNAINTLTTSKGWNLGDITIITQFDFTDNAPYPKSYYDTIVSAIISFCTSNGIRCINGFPPYTKADNVHPDDDGHFVIATYLLNNTQN